MKKQIEIFTDEVVVFHTFQQWVNHASSRLGGYDKREYKLLCIDKEGLACENGADFMKARDENRFPVTCYFIKLSRNN